MKETYKKIITTKIRIRTWITKPRLHPNRNVSKLRMTALISSTLLLSLAIFSAVSGESAVLAQQQPQQQPQSMSTTMTMMSSSSSLPQPNANGTWS
jgi:hypothetical protein